MYKSTVNWVLMRAWYIHRIEWGKASGNVSIIDHERLV